MRHIDEILEAVRNHPHIPPVHKQVLISRIEPEPTREELDRASAQVYPFVCTVPGHRGCDRWTCRWVPKCSKCGALLAECVECGKAALCGESWCLACTPDVATTATGSSSAEVDRA